MSATDATIVQVSAVRALLDQAGASLSGGGPVGAVVATLLADSALETLMKQCLSDLGKGQSRERTVFELTDELEKSVNGLAGHAGIVAVRKMRVARNPVQHGGLIPDPAGVAIHLREAGQFAAVLVRKVYDKDLEDFSVTALVSHPEIRGTLDQALALAAKGRNAEACVYAAAAYGLVFSRTGYWIRRVMDVTAAEEDYGPGTLDRAVAKVFGPSHPCAVNPRTDSAHWREITRLSLGFPLAELVFMKAIQDHASMVLDPDRQQEEPAVSLFDPSAIIRAVDVIARHVWRIESTEPGLLKGATEEE
jgi:hypothetical protein